MSVAVAVFLALFSALFVLKMFENAHIRSSYGSRAISTVSTKKKSWPLTEEYLVNIGKILRSTKNIRVKKYGQKFMANMQSRNKQSIWRVIRSNYVYHINYIDVKCHGARVNEMK